MKRLILFGCLSFSACDDGASVEYPKDEVCHASSQRPSELRWSFDSLESAQPHFGFEVAGRDNFRFVSQPAQGTDQALQLTVRGDQVINKGNRAEVSFTDSDPLCQQAWTRWHFMIPTDFVDAPADQLRWQIIAQWHDQPDTSLGQSWENYPGNSPMLALSYGTYAAEHQKKLDEVGIEIVFQPGDPIVTLIYGVGDASKLVGVARLSKGQWYEVTAHTYFSLGEDGFAGFWLNGEALVNSADGYARGRNMFNRAPAYLKMGIYRNPELKDDNSIYLDEFSRTARKEEL